MNQACWFASQLRFRQSPLPLGHVQFQGRFADPNLQGSQACCGIIHPPGVVCNALPSGGLLAIHDAHINADKSGPLPVAEYSVILMHSTEGKCYSVTEMNGYLVEAGFAGMEHHPTAADRSVIIARKAG